MKLQVTELGATYRVVRGYRSPFHCGSLWHGVLGHALRCSRCPAPGRSQAICEAPKHCAYSRFLASPKSDPTHPSLNAADVRLPKAGTPPPRLIPLLPSVGSMSLVPGNVVSLRVGVFGSLSEEDVRVLLAGFARIGTFPIGTDAGRIEFVDHLALTTRAFDTHASPPAHFDSDERLLLTLETPLCIKVRTPANDKKVLLRQLAFATLFDALHWRLTLLCSRFGQYLPLDTLRFRELRSQAQQVQVVKSQLRVPDWERTSARSGDKYAMAGVLGSVLYAGPVAQFVPLLELAEATHIGSDTSFGLGQVRFSQRSASRVPSRSGLDLNSDQFT